MILLETYISEVFEIQKKKKFSTNLQTHHFSEREIKGKVSGKYHSKH